MSKRSRQDLETRREERRKIKEKEDTVNAVRDQYEEHPPQHLNEIKAKLLTLGDQLYQGPSGVEGAGLGLFSRVDFKKGDLITWYDGVVVTFAEYDRLKKEDPNYLAYADALASKINILSNYRRNETGALVKIPDEELAQFYTGRGAFQFMNGGRLHYDSVNVGKFVIKEARRMVPRNYPLDHLAERERRLQDEFPDSMILVAVAFWDIPAGTELIQSYGDHYMDVLEYGWDTRLLPTCVYCSTLATFQCSRCKDPYCSETCRTDDGHMCPLK